MRMFALRFDNSIAMRSGFVYPSNVRIGIGEVS